MKRKSRKQQSKVVSSKVIITEKEYIDPETGEYIKLSRTENETEEETQTIAGGWTMVYYKSYDEILANVIKSNNDIIIFLKIKSLFTYKNVNPVINMAKISSELKTSRSSVVRLVKKLRTLQFIAKNDDGSYSLNPFIYIPYRSNGLELQEEWRNAHIDKMRESEVAHGISESEALEHHDILNQ